MLPDFDKNMCYSNGVPPVSPPVDATTPDRRIIGVAVGNCNALIVAKGGIGKNKNKPLPLASGDSAVNIFLSEAMGELDPNAFYGELVSPVGTGGNLTSVNLVDRIVLYR